MHWAYSWDTGKRYDWLKHTFSNKGVPLKVECDTKVNKGGLVLVPLTTSIGVGTKVPLQAVEVEAVDNILDGSGVPIRFWLNQKFELPVSKKQPGFLVSYWVTQAASDSSLANLEHSTLSIRTRAGGTKIAGIGEMSTYSDTYIPIMVNSFAIKAGDELLKPSLNLKRPSEGASSSSKAARV